LSEKGHLETCSHHPQNVKKGLLFRGLLDDSLTDAGPKTAAAHSGLPSLDFRKYTRNQFLKPPPVQEPSCDECGEPATKPHLPSCSKNPFHRFLAPKPKPALTCDECGQPLSKIHLPSCSKNPLHSMFFPKPGPKPEPPPKCDECGNEIKAPKDHSLICSKHPDHWRTRASRFSNVRFAPLIDDAEKGSAPSESPLLGYLRGEVCPDCGEPLASPLIKRLHQRLCPKRR
jgi:hypothetical protein